MQAQRSNGAQGPRLVSRAIALLGVCCAALAALPAAAQTLERVRDAGRIRLGYLADARPFTARNPVGAAEGYGAALCQQIADRVRTRLGIAQLAVDWVPVTLDEGVRDVAQSRIDLLCTPINVTLARREDVAFSIPVFAGGNRAVLRSDTARALREALSDTATPRPVWRGSPAAKVLENTLLAVVAGTPSAAWLAGRRTALQVDAVIVPVPDYRTGLQQLLDGEVDVFFGDRALVLGAIDDSERANLVVADRLFTHDTAALALARDDDDFRLLVDTTLSELYASTAFSTLYTVWFGNFDESTRQFFLWNTPAPQ